MQLLCLFFPSLTLHRSSSALKLSTRSFICCDFGPGGSSSEYVLICCLRFPVVKQFCCHVHQTNLSFTLRSSQKISSSSNKDILNPRPGRTGVSFLTYITFSDLIICYPFFSMYDLCLSLFRLILWLALFLLCSCVYFQFYLAAYHLMASCSMSPPHHPSTFYILHVPVFRYYKVYWCVVNI